MFFFYFSIFSIVKYAAALPVGMGISFFPRVRIYKYLRPFFSSINCGTFGGYKSCGAVFFLSFSFYVARELRTIYLIIFSTESSTHSIDHYTAAAVVRKSIFLENILKYFYCYSSCVPTFSF